jgi:hypothetical protein
MERVSDCALQAIQGYEDKQFLESSEYYSYKGVHKWHANVEEAGKSQLIISDVNELAAFVGTVT